MNEKPSKYTLNLGVWEDGFGIVSFQQLNWNEKLISWNCLSVNTKINLNLTTQFLRYFLKIIWEIFHYIFSLMLTFNIDSLISPFILNLSGLNFQHFFWLIFSWIFASNHLSFIY
jgi:hypothetical protein